jgi:hypothetical protein
MKRDIYGVCKDGLVLRARDDRFGVTGIMRWRKLFSPEAWRSLRKDMEITVDVFHQKAVAPSRNQTRRMRQRGQA